MKALKLMKLVLLVTSVMAMAALASAQNTVVAQFGTEPGAGSNFTVNLVNTGSVTEIAGFSFRVSYNPAQVALVSVADNTKQPKAGMQYTLGPEKVAADGSAYRDILAGTLVNLTDASNLAELKFEKKPGYAAPLQLKVEDRVHTGNVIDGLLGPAVENVPHVFDASQVNK
jgi:hypothetical protein